MGTGEIRDFSKPNPVPDAPTTPVRRLSAVTGEQNVDEVEVHVHEEIVTDDEKISRKFHEPQIRVRLGDRQEWEKIRYGKDE